MRTRSTIAIIISAAALLLSTTARADVITATMKFSNAYELLVQADRARDQRDSTKALALYKLALNTYSELISEDPDFQPRMVEFRMEYCDGQLAALLNEYYPADDAAPVANASPSNLVDEALALDSESPPAAPVADASPSNLVDEAFAPDSESPAGDTNTIQELLITARSEIENGEPEAARQRLLRGFEIDPDNADLRLLAGLAQCQARKFSDAVFLLSELADEQPSNAPIRVALAAAFFGGRQTNNARQELEAAIHLEPELKDAHYNMAQLLLAAPTPDLDAIDRHYRHARELGAAPDLRLENAIAEKQDE